MAEMEKELVEVTEEETTTTEIPGEEVSRETSSEEETVEEETVAEEITAQEEPAAEEKQPVLWSAEYVLTEEEMRAFIDNSGVVSSKTKTFVQAGLAAALCVINILSYSNGKNKMALFLAIVCAALCGAVLIVPYMTKKHMLEGLQAAATDGNPTRLASDGANLMFGAGEDILTHAYDTVKIKVYDTIATLLLADGQMVCVPQRAVSEDGWAELCAHVSSEK